MQTLNNKVALVTGASRGIGKGVAIALAKAGADVAINYAKNSALADDVVEAIQGLGRKAIAVQADVTKEADLSKLVSATKEKLGAVDILVNNAGILGTLAGEGDLRQEWDMVLNTNLKSAFLVTEEVLPDMKKSGWGRLIFMTSIAAQNGGRTGPHYAASKAGAIGLMHSYARALVKDGITANAISPAGVETDMVTIGLGLEVPYVPIGRFGTIEEAGDTAVFLAHNGYMTGQTINLNGGAYMSS